MNQLGQIHMDFLRKCASQHTHTHKPTDGITREELGLMVSEGLLIEYNRATHFEYTSTEAGNKVARQFGPSQELVDIALKYAISKGLSEEEAKQEIEKHGAEEILKAKAFEDRGGSTGQREIRAPQDFGNNIKKSF